MSTMSVPGAVFTDPVQAAAQAVELAGGALPAGFRVSLSTFCVVDDTKGAARERILEAIQSRYRQDFTDIVDATAIFGTPDDVRARELRLRVRAGFLSPPAQRLRRDS